MSDIQLKVPFPAKLSGNNNLFITLRTKIFKSLPTQFAVAVILFILHFGFYIIEMGSKVHIHDNRFSKTVFCLICITTTNIRFRSI